MTTSRPLLRCAIYTRKSTEEGLDQAFNSLHAQRAACEAYITSQAHEGWRLVKTEYDDGGYSGGSMDRPALKLLLQHVQERRVDGIVVYKVDRLTRSLTDFSRIVEVLDAAGCSFVSVTQSFNTTNSMGRLTLNVLLSFAQFEREVAGERIRDKIAASKKKGMWMGGNPPLGYDVQDRKLVVNAEEAKQVRWLYQRYVELGSAMALLQEAKSRGYRSKERFTGSGHKSGGKPMLRGQLYWLLANPIYIGEIRHRDRSWPGEHQPIIERPVWDAVQKMLERNRRKPPFGTSPTHALLAGLVFDDRGNAMSPTHTAKPDRRRYNYYASQALLQGRKSDAGSVPRIPAPKLEALVEAEVRGLRPPGKRRNVTGAEDTRSLIRDHVDRVVILPGSVSITLKNLSSPNGSGSSLSSVSVALPKRSRPVAHPVIHNTFAGSATSTSDGVAILRMLARAWRWRQMLEHGEAASLTDLANAVGVHRRYAEALIEQAFTPPSQAKAMLENQFLFPSINALLARPLGWNWES